MKVTQVCKPKDCDNKPTHEVDFVGKKFVFCCLKGFQKSINDFAEHMSKNKKVKENQ